MRTTEDFTLKCVIKRVNDLINNPKSKDDIKLSLWKLGYKVKRYLESEEISRATPEDKEILSKSYDIILKDERRLIGHPMEVLDDMQKLLASYNEE